LECLVECFYLPVKIIFKVFIISFTQVFKWVNSWWDVWGSRNQVKWVLASKWVESENLFEDKEWVRIGLELTISWKLDIVAEETVLWILVCDHLDVLCNVKSVYNCELVCDCDFWNQNHIIVLDIWFIVSHSSRESFCLKEFKVSICSFALSIFGRIAFFNLNFYVSFLNLWSNINWWAENVFKINYRKLWKLVKLRVCSFIAFSKFSRRYNFSSWVLFIIFKCRIFFEFFIIINMLLWWVLNKNENAILLIDT